MSNKLQLTQASLNAAKDLREMFEMDAVKHNAVQNLIKTTGKTDELAQMHYEREKILFFKAMQTNKKLEKCDRFSIYSSWVELFASGSTLNEGHAYIIPYGNTASFQMGWRGRLEQLTQVPSIVNIPPPQVVYENDEFDYELGERPRIIKHKPAKTNKGELIAVYIILQKDTGPETHLMLRDQVLNIRDVYSKPYIQYMADCKALGKEVGSTFKKNIGSYDITIEPPMWITSPEEAWKKTLIKRVYKWVPKTARMKALDERIKAHPDPETGEDGETHDIDYGMVDDTASTPPPAEEPKSTKKATPKKEVEPLPPVENVDESTGEVNPASDLPDLNDLSTGY